jgi:hypothetical protein
MADPAEQVNLGMNNEWSPEGGSWVARDRCYDFLNLFAEKFSKKLAFLTQNKAKF